MATNILLHKRHFLPLQFSFSKTYLLGKENMLLLLKEAGLPNVNSKCQILSSFLAIEQQEGNGPLGPAAYYD